MFTMSNPGHLLFTVGVALVVAGSVLLLLGQALRRAGAPQGRRVAAIAASVSLVLLSALTFTTAVAGQGGSLAGGGSHVHGPGEMADGGHEGHGTPAPAATPAGSSSSSTPTLEQRAAANKLLADIRVGVASYADVNVAMKTGYVQSTRWAAGTWGPAHYTNFTYSRDGKVLDVERPESLVYIKLPGGRVVLLGVMFSAPQGQGPRPGGPLTDWHTHDNLCISAAGQAVLATNPGQCPAGAFFVGERIEMMHIWLFDHPEGPFAHALSGDAIRAALRQFGGR